MIDNLRKYWFLYIPISGLIVWFAVINSRIFDSPEQKVEVINAVKTMPTEAERAVELANASHAIEIRQMRYEDNKKEDSIRLFREKEKDSLTLDAFKRFTVQIEQLEAKIDNQ